MNSSEITLKPIGYVRSVFKEKFGVPRQPGLAPHSTAVIELVPPFNKEEMTIGLEQFSHLWIVFIFHKTADGGWSAQVRPPRLGGNKRIGVFASRSTYRPNPIGLSVVKLKKIEHNSKGIYLHIENVDLIDGTPVLDIKPYLPYADSISDAAGGYAENPPNTLLSVVFKDNIQERLSKNSIQLITEVLQQDPRPAYKSLKPDDKIYGITLENYNIKFSVRGSVAEVLGITELEI